MKFNISSIYNFIFILIFSSICGSFIKYGVLLSSVLQILMYISIPFSFFILLFSNTFRSRKISDNNFLLFLFISLEIVISLFYFTSVYKDLIKYMGVISVVIISLTYFRNDYSKLMKCIYKGLIIFLMASIYAIFKENQIGNYLTGTNNGIVGAGTHKNVFALALIHLLIFSLCYLKVEYSNPKKHLKKIMLYISISIFCIFLIFLSNSASCILCSLFLIIYYLRYEKLKMINFSYLYLIFNLLLITYSYMYEKIGLGSIIREYLNRDITLTGRTDIWTSTISALNEYNLWGYGINSFGDDKFQRYVLSNVYALPGLHAHNNLLMTTVDAGIIGLVVFIMLIVIYYKKMSGFRINNTFLEAIVFFEFCSFAIVGSIDYTLTPGTISQFMFYLIFFMISNKYYRRQ